MIDACFCWHHLLLNFRRCTVALAYSQNERLSCGCTLPAAPTSPNLGIEPNSIKESFQVWRQETTPQCQENPSTSSPTQQEMVILGLATIRESSEHRHWPREIVERFIAAEIITNPRVSRSSQRELNASARFFNFLRIPAESYATVANMLRR